MYLLAKSCNTRSRFGAAVLHAVLLHPGQCLTCLMLKQKTLWLCVLGVFLLMCSWCVVGVFLVRCCGVVGLCLVVGICLDSALVVGHNMATTWRQTNGFTNIRMVC